MIRNMLKTTWLFKKCNANQKQQYKFMVTYVGTYDQTRLISAKEKFRAQKFTMRIITFIAALLIIYQNVHFYDVRTCPYMYFCN